MYADFFRYSPHESEDSAVASDEEEEDEDDSELELDGAGGEAGGAGAEGGGGGRQRNRQYTEMKEQMYQDKLQHLKRQLEQLNDASLPEYSKKLRRLEGTYRERMRICAVIRDLEVDMVEQDYLNEKRSAVREFEEEKVRLRDQLILELEEKQRLIEAERHTLELTGDNMDIKPISKRNLRRRVHDGGGAGGGAGGSGYGNDKRRGGNGGGGKTISMVSLNFLLEDNDIHDDLKIINKNRAFAMNKSSQGQQDGGACGNASSASTSSGGGAYHRDTRIEEGKLFYEKRWFRRGQSVQVESKTEKFPAMITAIGTEDILVRKSTDNTKLRIYLTWLTKGKYILKRRAA